MTATLVADEKEIKQRIEREVKHIREKIKDDLTPAISLIDRLSDYLNGLIIGNFGSTMTLVLKGIHSLIIHTQNMEDFLKGTTLESKPVLIKGSLQALISTLDRQEIKTLVKNNNLLSQREQWKQEHRDALMNSISGQKKFFEDLKTDLEREIDRRETEKHEHMHS